jgi:hypothetical protein
MSVDTREHTHTHSLSHTHKHTQTHPPTHTHTHTHSLTHPHPPTHPPTNKQTYPEGGQPYTCLAVGKNIGLRHTHVSVFLPAIAQGFYARIIYGKE